MSFKFTPEHAETIRKIIDYIDGDGHVFYKPSVLEDWQLPPEAKARFVEHAVSDIEDYKRTMFDNHGNIIKDADIVYGLKVLRAIASDLGLTYLAAFGRGTEARRATAAIREWLDKRFPEGGPEVLNSREE